MAGNDINKDEIQDEPVDKQRRKFLKTSGKAAVIAPAVSLILASGSKPAAAQEVYAPGNGGGGCGGGS
jgi:hypothetical protein